MLSWRTRVTAHEFTRRWCDGIDEIEDFSRITNKQNVWRKQIESHKNENLKELPDAKGSLQMLCKARRASNTHARTVADNNQKVYGKN